MTTPTSPTLTMKVRAPEALAAFRALRQEADLLKVSLASLSASGSRRGGTTRLQAEVRELRAALVATRLEVDNLQKALEAQTARAGAALARQTAQVKQQVTQQRVAKKQALDLMDRDAEAAVQKQSLRDIREQQRIAAMAGRYRQQAIDAVGAARARTLDPRLLIGVQSTAEATRASTMIRTQMEGEARMAALHAAALAENARRTAMLTREKEKTAAAASRVTSETKKMSEAQAIARSTARGVSGALGGLWLTYGQVLPALAAGFAAAVAIRETFQRGAEFQYQMQFVGALGERSPENVRGLGDAVLNLSRDQIFGPVELAKGLRVLEQAGLDAEDSLGVLTTSMRVALQGETDLTKSSELLVGVMNEFALTVNDIPRIGDVLSKIAADTPSSLMQVGESMKQVVGIATRFNIELETSAAMIGLLAQRRIVGSSAGTFTRRMFEEIFDPRSQQSQRLMKHLGLTPFDSEGNLKKDMQVIDEFVQKMRELDKPSQVKALGVIFDQRAKKAAAELVADYEGFLKLRRGVDEASGSLEKFEEVLGKALIPEWKKAMSNLEGSMVQAFRSMEPVLIEFVGHLSQFVKSREFQETLKLLLLLPKGAAAVANASARHDRVSQSSPEEALAEIDRQIAGMERGGLISGPTKRYGAGGRGLRSAELEALYQARGRLASGMRGGATLAPHSPEIVDEISRFRAMEAGSITTASGSASTTGTTTLDKRFLDEQAAREELALSQAQDQATVSRFRREAQRMDQEANFGIALTEEKHRGMLISENTYMAEIERINAERRQRAIELANEELQHLEDQVDNKWTEAQKLQNLIKQDDIRAKRDELLRESDQAKDIRRIRGEGKVKQIRDETSKTLEKARREEELRAEQRDLSREARLLSPESAAQMQAEFEARKRFSQELLDIEAELARQAGDGPAVDALKERRRLILDLRDAWVAVQGAEAAADVQFQRTWGYGQQDAFRTYVDNAADAAQQARDVWGATLQGLENSLTNLFMTGKAGWRDFANSIIAELLRIQIRKQLAGIAAMFLPSGNTPGTLSLFGGVSSATGHTGGIVGSLSASRIISPLAFAGAPRFHGGGIVGDEQPIIAKRGEGVFTPEQMKRLAPRGGNVTVNLHNESGVALEANVSPPIIDGEEVVLDLFVRRLARDGGARQTVKQLLSAPT